MEGFKVEVEHDGWAESENDGGNCFQCEKPIEGKMYLGQISVMEELFHMRLCEPCYNDPKTWGNE